MRDGVVWCVGDDKQVFETRSGSEVSKSGFWAGRGVGGKGESRDGLGGACLHECRGQPTAAHGPHAGQHRGTAREVEIVFAFSKLAKDQEYMAETTCAVK